MAIYTYGGTILTQGNALAVHVDCCCGANNEQWKKCSDNTNAVVLAPSATTHDYVWIKIGGVWVPCYNDSLTASSFTTPDILEQCGTTPTSCGGLVGWVATDDFGGTGCNCGSVADTNYTVVWNEVVGVNPTSYSITGGQMVSVVGLQTTQFEQLTWQRRFTDTVSGDFSLKVDLAISSLSSTASNIYGPDAGIYAFVGGTFLGLRYFQDTQNNLHGIVSFVGGVSNIEEINTTNNGSWNLRITRVGSTVTFYIDDVSYRTYTKTGNVTTVAMLSGNYAPGSGSDIAASHTASFDNFSFTGASGASIYYDPTGLAVP